MEFLHALLALYFIATLAYFGGRPTKRWGASAEIPLPMPRNKKWILDRPDSPLVRHFLNISFLALVLLAIFVLVLWPLGQLGYCTLQQMSLIP